MTEPAVSTAGTDDWVPPLMWAAVPPPVVVLPSRPVVEGAGEAQVVLREVRGRLLILAYTSPDMLVRCCGTGQPWVALAAVDVEDLRVAVGADSVVLNMPLAPEDPA